MTKKLFHGFEVLTPKEKPLVVRGKLRYHESTRSNSLILLKQEIRDLFLDFGDLNPMVEYQFEYHRSLDKLSKRIEELPEGAMPFLMFLVKPEGSNH